MQINSPLAVEYKLEVIVHATNALNREDDSMY
jgi:hypothetical protein